MSLIQHNEFNFKRISVLAGHYGSGKTNIAVNFALHRKGNENDITIADLDIVNPYYRTKDSADMLSKQGITLVSSEYANTNVDVPALPAAIYDSVVDGSRGLVIDVGGDDRGAYALGRFADAIKEEGDYRMALVLNRYRPLTSTVEGMLEIIGEIETAAGIKFNCIVNNSNIGPETTKETVLESLAFAESVSLATGLPIWLHTAEKSVADEITEFPVMPLTLQKKYF